MVVPLCGLDVETLICIFQRYRGSLWVGGVGGERGEGGLRNSSTGLLAVWGLSRKPEF